MSWFKKIYARILPSSKFQIATEASKMQELSLSILQEIEKQGQKEDAHYRETSELLRINIDMLNEIKNLCLKLKNSLFLIESCTANEPEGDLNECIATLLTAVNSADAIIKKIDSVILNSADIGTRVDTLINSVEEIDHIYQYDNNYERDVISSFNECYDAPDYRDRFLRLIDGLDEETIDEVVKILQRQYLIKNTKNQKLNLYTFEEQKLIKDMQRELNNEIYRIDDGMYCYKHWFLPIKHFEASVFIYQHGIGCIENTDILRNKDILDVGGFIGDSILILKTLTDRRIISFEAVAANFELMKKTVAMNHLDNVILEHIALGDNTTTKKVFVSGSTSSFHTNGAVKVKYTEEVNVLPLDDYMKDKDYDIGLIKVDIEGAEQAFLQGAIKTIKKFHPVLLISIYHNADDFFNIKPLIDSWNLGYKFKIHKPADNTISREVLLIAEVL